MSLKTWQLFFSVTQERVYLCEMSSVFCPYNESQLPKLLGIPTIFKMYSFVVVFCNILIRMVYVSHGDGSDFHHLQVVVGYLIAVRIRMSAFISHHLHKNPQPNYLLYFDEHQGHVVI